MNAPLSWLKKYVDITLTPKELGDRLTEVGLSTEKILKENNDTIFDLEITPNRPDLLSVVGVAREVAAIEGKKILYPKTTTDLSKVKPKRTLPLKIVTDHALNPRFSGIIIDNITVKESPEWLKKDLEKMGQRSINNIVDITNYVMLELGNPLHAFDYDKITGHTLTVNQAKEGEEFTSVDGIKYRLPKWAVVIRDTEKIIDLCGLKGGENSGTYQETKTIFLRAPVEDPIRIRKTSQMLSLRSEASSIFERGVNKGGTIDALNRATDLILELAGGEITSTLYDLKKQDFKPWELTLRLERLNFMLGIIIDEKKILAILESLYLSPKLNKGVVTVTVPTFRNDLTIEEDLIEEVARHYGYNNFPKTLPGGNIPVKPIPYFRDYKREETIKNIMCAAGFNEVFTYSLISEKNLQDLGINSEDVLRVDNPVSREFEYLRPTLRGNLINALRQNKANFTAIHLFELGKIYIGKNLTQAKEEYVLAGISNTKSYFAIKGLIGLLFEKYGISDDITKYIQIIPEGIYFEVPYALFTAQKSTYSKFIPIPKYPPIVEDVALSVPTEVKTDIIISFIKKQSNLIADVSLLDRYQNTRTFHIVYQDTEKNMTTDEVKKIREKTLHNLEKEFHTKLKS